MLWLTLSGALVFVAIHLFIGHLRMLSVLPRSVWLSVAGGIAVAYIFLHVLPDLVAQQAALSVGLNVAAKTAETLVFLVALVGLTLFYGLERLVSAARRPAGAEPSVRVFWLHLSSFALYNALITYLLVHRREEGLSSLLLYAFAMATHVLTTDFGLRQQHRGRYDGTGRYVLTGAVLLGWGIAQTVALPPVAIVLLFALLAGSAVLNTVKEELPEERESRFWAFLLGAAGYSALLVVL